MRYLVVALLLLTACVGKRIPKTYQLSNGQTVRCTNAIYGGGTTDLEGCEDGNEYLNQTNLKRVYDR